MLSIYSLPIASVNIIMLFGIVAWTAVFWFWGRRHPKGFRAVNSVLAAIAVITILYATVISRKPQIAQVDLLPFHSLCRAKYQPEIYRSMLMNAFLFYPLGLFFPFAVSNKKLNGVVITLAFAAVLSVLIEFLQFKFNLGLCETDDVIMNTFGVAMGSIGFVISKYLCNKK